MFLANPNRYGALSGAQMTQRQVVIAPRVIGSTPTPKPPTSAAKRGATGGFDLGEYDVI